MGEWLAPVFWTGSDRGLRPVRPYRSATGRKPWGRFLDGGAGVNSALGSTGLASERWVRVTGSAAHARQVEGEVGSRLRPESQLILGNWTDETLLVGQRFDTVPADYLLGAVEGFSPYF